MISAVQDLLSEISNCTKYAISDRIFLTDARVVDLATECGGQAGEIVEGLEDAKGIPESPISLRTVAVPGTRNLNQSHTPIG